MTVGRQDSQQNRFTTQGIIIAAGWNFRTKNRVPVSKQQTEAL